MIWVIPYGLLCIFVMFVLLCCFNRDNEEIEYWKQKSVLAEEVLRDLYYAAH